LFLANLGVNFALAGLNVIYFTFELSEELVGMRVDSMLTGIASKDIFKNLDDVEMKVKLTGRRAGGMQIKYLPSGKNCNDLRSYLKEYQVKTGKKPDIILVDYLDLMMPLSVKVSPSDLFVKDKYVSEELRNFAMETQAVVVTAAQLNRSAVEEIEFDHSHISGGLSKIQTADNVIGIFTSRAMRERGRYQIQFMKTRSSSGVGQKVDLEFDIDSLRIKDLGDEEDSGQSFNQQRSAASNALIDGLKKTSVVTSTNVNSETGEIIDPTKGISVSKMKQSVSQPMRSVRDILSSFNPEKD
jgi:replicative DNA helicase